MTNRPIGGVGGRKGGGAGRVRAGIVLNVLEAFPGASSLSSQRLFVASIDMVEYHAMIFSSSRFAPESVHCCRREGGGGGGGGDSHQLRAGSAVEDAEQHPLKTLCESDIYMMKTERLNIVPIARCIDEVFSGSEALQPSPAAQRADARVAVPRPRFVLYS